MAIKRPAVAAETDYAYTDKSSGRQLSFTPSPREVMVTFQESASEETLNEVLQATPLLSVSQGFDLDRGFAAVYVSPDQDIERAIRALDERRDIANSLPAMVDQDGLTRYFLPDEFTVQFKDGVTERQAEQIIGERGSRILSEQRTPGYYTVLVPGGRGLFEAIREFSDLDEVHFAEPSEIGFNTLAQFPSDPLFPLQWGLNNTGQGILGVTGIPDSDIDMPEGWNVLRGDPAVIVAVIDTGVDLDHLDLQANILPRGGEDWDFADPADPVPEDEGPDAGHGTHVAGIVAAAANGVGVVGVAPSCRIMPLRVDLRIGMLPSRADAINYVAQQATANPDRRYVINGSWVMNGDNAGVRTAIQNAVNRNVVVVFAAGNTGQSLFPGVYPEVIAVAALDKFDRMASFTNFGPTIDVCAPGKDIMSTLPNDTFGFLSGTSMAAPHAAGLAALIWSGDLTLTNAQVRQRLEDTCDSLDANHPGFVGMLGRGRINAGRAVIPRRRLGFDSGRLDFGIVSVEFPETQALTIRSIGQDPVTVSFPPSPDPAVDPQAVFSWTATDGVLAPGSGTTVVVRCAPHGRGDFQAQLVVASDAFGSPHPIQLSATGFDPFDPVRP